MTKLEQLARLQNRPTRYEIAATKGERRILVGYTARKSRHGILAMLRQRGAEMIERLEIGESDLLTTDKGALLVSGWRIAFTGRTQRDCIMEGELTEQVAA